jgi:CDP-diacylglycerol--serine O-phosphatidyltransferase
MRWLSTAFPFVRFLDAANLITAVNIVLAFVTVALAQSGHLSSAATTMCLAAAIDFIDGHVARTYLADRGSNRAFGKQLDSLADLLNFSVAPALLLVHVSDSTLAGVIAGSLVLSGALRLAVFGATSPAAPTSYAGLPTTYSGLLLALAYQAVAAQQLPHGALLGLVALISVMQVTGMPVPKFRAIPTVVSIAVAFAAVTMLIHSI